MNNSTASTSISCTYSYGDISSISRYILGTGFVICSILATTGSIISLIILQRPSMRCKKSNKILSSLSTSDTLVGLGLCIVFTIQMLSEDLRSSCFLENTKNILAPWMIGTSSLNIALISYDRYVMLSSLTNYDIKMSKRRLYFLILSTWITPILFTMTFFINRLLFMAALALFTIIPLIIIIIAYCMVVKFVKKNSFVKESEDGQSSKKENNRRLVQRLSFLVFCYFICLLPLMVNFFWEIFNRLSKQEKSVTHQTLTVVGALCACVNSVLNPIIYFSKFPDFQREFRKMFGLRGNAVIETNSTNNDTTSERVN
ncbi:cannabinoid receptor 1-like [Clytia hemisphaerica]|uniref:cannabinoid receptor 1-like n=1 Tax=Clytia hemisphaerica TaxID=252671 RepID=UPI0034D641F6